MVLSEEVYIIKKILLMVLVLALVFIAGCGGECKVDSDCTRKNACFTAKCEAKLCVQTALPDCCGNDIPETNEGGLEGNKCTCPSDWGLCAGPVEGSTLLEIGCNEEKTECASILDPSKQQEKVFSHDLRSTIGTLKVDTRLKLPFNIDKDLVNIRFELPDPKTGFQDITLTKLELFGTNVKKEKVELAEKDLDRVFWTPDTVIEEELIIKPKTKVVDEELSSLKLKISFKYNEERRGALTEKTGSVENLYRTIKFRYVNPDITPVCPESCDDDNPATKDSCSVQTNFFCEHTPIRGRCGNYECESNEDKCTCPQDCGACGGDVGQYMENFCYEEKQCSTQLKPSLSLESVTDFEERNLNKFKLIAKYTYDKPFDLKQSVLNINYELSTIREGVTQPKILTVRLFEGTKLLAEQEVARSFSAVGSNVVVDLPISLQIEDEVSKSVSLKVWYEYTETVGEQSEVKTATYSKSLGSFDFINPDVSEVESAQ